MTDAAEHSSPGCANAVRTSLEEVKKTIEQATGVKQAIKGMGMCTHTIPDYITELKTLSADTMMAIAFSFADYDMDAYPPGPDLGLYKACQIFQDDDSSSMEKVKHFFQLLKEDAEFTSEYPESDDDEFDTDTCL